MNDCQKKLNKSNKELWSILTKKQESYHGSLRLPQFSGSKDEDFVIWFEDFKITIHHSSRSEEETLAIFKKYLSGDARHVYEGFNQADILTLEGAWNRMNQVFAVAKDQQVDSSFTLS